MFDISETGEVGKSCCKGWGEGTISFTIYSYLQILDIRVSLNKICNLKRYQLVSTLPLKGFLIQDFFSTCRKDPDPLYYPSLLLKYSKIFLLLLRLCCQ